MKFIQYVLIPLSMTLLGNAKEFTSAVITHKINTVNITHRTKAAKIAHIKDVLSPSNVLQSGKHSRAELSFPDKSISRVGANTSLSFSSKGRSIYLEKGSMLLQVPKHEKSATIRSSSVTATVSGATVLFEHNKGKWIKLISLEGKVYMTSQKAGKVKLKPGQMIFFKEDGSLLLSPIDVDLKRLVATAGLLSEKKFGSLPKESSENIKSAIAKQQKEINKGVLTSQKVTQREPLSHVSKRIHRTHVTQP